MNYQSYQPDQFVDFLHSQYEVEYTRFYYNIEYAFPHSCEYSSFPGLIPNPPFVSFVRRSRFQNLWKTAVKYYINWTSFAYLESQKGEINLRELSDALSGLFECLRYVWATIDRTNKDDYFLGMNFILPFFTKHLIRYDIEIQTKGIDSVYRSMISDGMKDFIEDVFDSIKSHAYQYFILKEIFDSRVDKVYEIITYIHHWLVSQEYHLQECHNIKKRKRLST